MKAIPHRSHRVWLQGRENLPDHLADLCQGFDDLHPGWSHEWWSHERICDEVDLREARQVYLDAELYVPPDSVMQMRADIARYAIARQYGGVTLDVDYAWQKPIDDLIRSANVVLGWEADNQWVACGFMAANPKHTLFTKVLAGIPARAAEIAGRGLRANAFTGPKYLTPIVKALGERADLRILPAATLHPVPWSDAAQPYDPARFPEAVAVHLWAHQRAMRIGGVWRTWDDSDEPVLSTSR